MHQKLFSLLRIDANFYNLSKDDIIFIYLHVSLFSNFFLQLTVEFCSGGFCR